MFSGAIHVVEIWWFCDMYALIWFLSFVQDTLTPLIPYTTFQSKLDGRGFLLDCQAIMLRKKDKRCGMSDDDYHMSSRTWWT
jgi:hypothetical protein